MIFRYRCETCKSEQELDCFLVWQGAPLPRPLVDGAKPDWSKVGTKGICSLCGDDTSSLSSAIESDLIGRFVMGDGAVMIG